MTNPKWLEIAAQRSGDHTWTLGHVFARYRELEGRSPEELAAELGCSLEVLAWLSLCRRPDEEHFVEHVEAIGKRFEVDLLQLAALIRRVESLDVLPMTQEGESRRDGSLLLVARDRTPEDDEPES